MAAAHYLDIEGLRSFKTLFQEKVDPGIARALKSAALSPDGTTIYLYREASPTDSTVPAYEIEIPNASTAVEGLMPKVTGGTAGDILSLGAGGVAVDSGTKVSDLTAAIGDKADKSSVYTKEEINSRISGLWHFSGTVDTAGDLPENANEGDVYIVAVSPNGANAEYGRTKEGTWEYIGGTLDLSLYAKAQDLTDALIETKNYTDQKSAANKTLLDSLAADVASNTSGIASGADKITALEGKVGDGIAPIQAADIQALFTN